MIIVALINLIISCVFQGTISNFLGYTYSSLSLFSTIYPLITLLILNPYFENKRKYLLLLIIFGLITDVAYTNTLLLNITLFIIAYYFSKLFHFFFPYNLFTINISNVLSIMIYHIITFILLVILNYDYYSLSVLSKILSHSILMTIIYTSITYILVRFTYKRLELKEVK